MLLGKKDVSIINMKKLLFFCGICLWALHAMAVDYEAIDKYAHDAPPLREKSALSRLVRYLVKPYKTDEEKARVLLAWIVHNIDYDDYKNRAIEDNLNRSKKRDKNLIVTQNDILETRMGVCGDIARLYEKMVEMAGMDAVVIRGNAGRNMSFEQFESKDGAHAWNAVKIDREWQYVDPTWAMDGEGTHSLQDISQKKEYQKTIKERKKRNSDVKLPREGRFVNNEWFLTDKEEMIKTHFPDDEKWQLQKKKITKMEFLGLDRKEMYESKREYDKKRRKNTR